MVKEVQESPESLPQPSFEEVDKLSKRINNIKLDSIMESQQLASQGNSLLCAEDNAVKSYKDWVQAQSHQLAKQVEAPKEG